MNTNLWGPSCSGGSTEGSRALNAARLGGPDWSVEAGPAAVAPHCPLPARHPSQSCTRQGSLKPRAATVPMQMLPLSSPISTSFDLLFQAVSADMHNISASMPVSVSQTWSAHHAASCISCRQVSITGITICRGNMIRACRTLRVCKKLQLEACRWLLTVTDSTSNGLCNLSALVCLQIVRRTYTHCMSHLVAWQKSRASCRALP